MVIQRRIRCADPAYKDWGAFLKNCSPRPPSKNF